MKLSFRFAIALMLLIAIPRVVIAKGRVCRVIASFQISVSKSSAEPRQALASTCEKLRESIKTELSSLMTVTNTQDSGLSSRFGAEIIGEWNDPSSWEQSGEKVDEALARVATACASEGVTITVRPNALCR